MLLQLLAEPNIEIASSLSEKLIRSRCYLSISCEACKYSTGPYTCTSTELRDITQNEFNLKLLLAKAQSTTQHN